MLSKMKDIASIKDKRVVLLQSGGLDSCFIAFYLKYFGFEIHHLYIDYGQKAREKELIAAKKIVNRVGGELHCVTIDMPWLKDSTILVDDTKDIGTYKVSPRFGCVQSGVYVPLRNHVLISIAGSLAESLGIPYIASGIDGLQDIFGRPVNSTDKHKKFAEKLEDSITEASTLYHIHGKKIKIIAPMIRLTKEQEIKFGTEVFGAHWEDSWTCYNSKEKPCGECCACKDRLMHFKNAGIEDPTEYLSKD